MSWTNALQDNQNTKFGGTTDEMNQSIVFVKKVAFSMKKKLPKEIELNDLIQSGMIGLLEAKNNFDSEYGVNFHQFALLRVRGAMIDFLRKNSWLSRESNKSTKMISNTKEKLERQGLSNPSSEQMSKEMGVDLDVYYKMTETSSHRKMMDINDYLEWLSIADEKPMEETLFLDQMKGKVNLIIQSFESREKIVLSLYYNEGLTFKQISEILDLTEARICQIHAQLISKIQKRLKVEENLNLVQKFKI